MGYGHAVMDTPCGREGSEGAKGSQGSEGVVGAFKLLKAPVCIKPLQPPCGRWKSGPLWWLAPPPLPRWEACHWILSRPRAPCESSSLATPQAGAQQPVHNIEPHMGLQPRGALLSTVHILHRMCKSGEVRRLACP